MEAMLLVRSTYGSETDAANAARRLVEGRLACCVHVSAVRSVFRWEGRMEEEREWLLEARTPPEQRGALVAALGAAHPYDLPLVEVVGETRVSREYADWARDCLKPDA